MEGVCPYRLASPHQHQNYWMSSAAVVIKPKTKKEPEEVKSKDGVIKGNLERIWVSVAIHIHLIYKALSNH